jgi:FecR-like protein
MRKRALITGGLLVTLVLLLRGTASAQEVGTVTGAEPTAEIGRGGVWAAAVVGAVVQQGDVLRTGQPGRLSVVFQDESVVNVAPGSELVVDEQLFAPEQGTVRSVMRLLQGRVRAMVSDYYRGTTAGFEVKTPTALAGVRGTDFVVTYDPTAEVTEVVDISGSVSVHNLLDPEHHGVLITAGELTVVAQGQRPEPPTRLSEKRFRQYIDGLEFIGGGAGVTLPFGNALASGATVPNQDRALNAAPVAPAPVPALATAPGENPYATPDASSLAGQSPAVLQASKLGIAF